jgi:uncharacterized iron-regulated membrane protein
MTIRKIIFWPHLIAGLLAAIVILVMSVTGVLLTYERQLIAWADRQFQSTIAGSNPQRAPVAIVLKNLSEAHPDAQPATVTFAKDPQKPVTIAAGQRTFFADVYTGAILGESTGTMRRAMSDLRSWHRWLAVEGEGRPLARAITGWSNFLFAFIVLSGMYLWLPKAWTWIQFRAVLLFNGRIRGKARDFNWHNVIGIWSAVPLFIVVVSAVPISFPWANAAIYTAMGEPVPAGRGGGGGRGEGPRDGGRANAAAEGRREGAAPNVERARAGEGAGGERSRGGASGQSLAALDGLDRLLARAEQQESDWRTIALRLPADATAPVSFAIDRGDGGQPHLRSTLTLIRATGAIDSYETFASQTPARRLRSIMRFAHTGEVLGIIGQTIAGLVTAGSLVLVWTGVALSWRRFRAWLGRRARRPAREPIPAADSAA